MNVIATSTIRAMDAFHFNGSTRVDVKSFIAFYIIGESAKFA